MTSHTYTFLPNGTELFYQNKDELVEEKEENAGELAFWDMQKSTPTVDCFADIFYGMTLENSTLEGLPEKVNFDDLLSIIAMKRPPFDYTTSQALLNFTDVLQLFDEHHKDFALPSMMKALDEQLHSIRGFLTFLETMKVSYYKPKLEGTTVTLKTCWLTFIVCQRSYT